MIIPLELIAQVKEGVLIFQSGQTFISELMLVATGLTFITIMTLN